VEDTVSPTSKAFNKFRPRCLHRPRHLCLVLPLLVSAAILKLLSVDTNTNNTGKYRPTADTSIPLILTVILLITLVKLKHLKTAVSLIAVVCKIAKQLANYTFRLVIANQSLGIYK